MYLYSGLFYSMLACCDRAGLRHAPPYTLSMLALGLGFAVNLLTVIDLLWALGVLANPYRIAHHLHPQHYLCTAMVVLFLANTVMARRTVYASRLPLQQPAVPRFSSSAFIAPAYVLGSVLLFVMTLGFKLHRGI